MQAAYIAEGIALNDAYGIGGMNGTLTCSSDAVTASNFNIVAPPTCTAGETITVTITSDLTFSDGPLFDFGVYTSLDSSDARNGATCAHDVLNQELAWIFPNEYQDLDGDSCIEVISGWMGYLPELTLSQYSFRSDLEVTCQGTGNVEVENCYSWKSYEEDMMSPPCDFGAAAVPGSVDSCSCQTITLPTVVV